MGLRVPKGPGSFHRFPLLPSTNTSLEPFDWKSATLPSTHWRAGGTLLPQGPFSYHRLPSDPRTRHWWSSRGSKATTLPSTC